MKRAIIDLGSNSIKSLLCDGGKLLFEYSTIGRLVKGMRGDLLAEASISRNLLILQAQIQDLQAQGAEQIDIYATQALRHAANQDILIDALKASTGIIIKLLDEDMEAHYSYLAAIASLVNSHTACVFDLGGASLEISYPDAGGELARQSLPLGAMSLAQDFLPHLPPSPQAIATLRTHLTTSLIDLPPFEMIGVGGSLCILAALTLGIYDEHRINGYLLSISELEAQIDQLSGLDKEQTSLLPGMQKGREDSILAGAIVCHSLLQAANAQALRISTRGWRHHLAGIL